MYSSKHPTQDQLLNDIVDLKLFKNRIIVAGSRGFFDYDFFAAKMKELIPTIEGEILFYSGKAKTGADKLIIDFCEREHYLYYLFPADWDRFQKRAGYIRNEQMAEDATMLIAFYDGKSKGTKHMIEIAHKKQIKTIVIDINLSVQVKKIKLFTIQVPYWRIANNLGIKFVDTTAKSGIKAFAPEMENVMAYKHGEMNEEQYTRLYLDWLTNSQVLYPKHWKHLETFEAMALGCYCKPDTFCHRHLFIQVVKDYLEKNEYDVELCGELTPDNMKP